MHFNLASVCHHELSYSFAPVGHSITVSTTRLCEYCETFERTGEWVSRKAESLARVMDVHDFALFESEVLGGDFTISEQDDDSDWEDVPDEEEYARLSEGHRSQQKLIRFLNVDFFSAYAQLSNERDQLEELNDPQLPTINSEGRCTIIARGPGAKGIMAMFSKAPKTRTRLVRFSGSQIHTPEWLYRSTRKYRRSSPQYRPGRHADTKGHGFWNTNNPYIDVLEDMLR